MVKRPGYFARTLDTAKRHIVEGSRLAYRSVKHVGTQYPNVVNAAVAAGVNTALGYISSGTQTKSKKKSGTKAMYGGNSVLSGIVRARRRARTYRGRKLRKYKRQIDGVSYQGEYVARAFGDKCIYVGNSTACADELIYLLVMTCMKAVLKEAGLTISSFSTARLPVIPDAALFYFNYKPNTNTAFTSLNMSYAVLPLDVSYWDIVKKLGDIIIASFKAGTVSDGIILTEFVYQSGSTVSIQRINLLDSKVNWFVKTSLKLQNRSVAAAGDDEMDVNNVPVYGKLYTGWGNGVISRSQENVVLLNGENLGVPIAYNGSGSTNFAEPPPAYEFTHCRKVAKFYLNPGSIKTGILSYKKTMKLNEMVKVLLNYYDRTTSNLQWYGLGKFQIFGIERVIAKTGGEISPAIDITYEIDWKGWMHLIPANNKFVTAYKNVL